LFTNELNPKILLIPDDQFMYSATESTKSVASGCEEVSRVNCIVESITAFE